MPESTIHMYTAGCPPLEQLERFVAGEPESQALARHVADCANCRAAAARLRENNNLLAVFAPGTPDDNAVAPLGWASDSIPGYRLTGELHRGGQGVVYQAMQLSTRRRVAVKVMREGAFASEEEKIRFEREVRILGQLQHPSIVAIHDSGQVAGRAYFVMDYIPGKRLDEWITALGSPAAETAPGSTPKSRLKDTLRLFAQICEAVNVAHLRGVIHRDLKPGNIRVDPGGRPHILDFGLAKVSEFDILNDTRTSAMTATGQFVGSLPWAAPEQAAGRPQEIDTRTDVYALGVILYQMLTQGEFPYEVNGPMRDVLERIAKSAPARPSLRYRGIDHEIETIVLKCLQKERDRRYQTAGELARDVRHYLKNEPIEARRDSALYVLRKTLRRHWVAVGVASAFILLLLVATVALSLMYRQQSRERAKAEAIAAFMRETLAGAGPAMARGRDTQMLQEMLAVTAARIERGELKSIPDAELQLRLTIGDTYRQIAGKKDAYDEAERMLRPALDIARTLHADDHTDVARALSELARLHQDRGQLPEAESLFRQALEMRRRLFPGDHPEVAANVDDLAWLLQARGDLTAAEPLFREGLAMRRRLFPDNHRDVATSLCNLAALLKVRGELTAAEPLFREALAMQRQLFPGDHPDVAATLNNLAALLQDRGDLAAAEPLYRESLAMIRHLLPDDHPDVAANLNNLAKLLQDRGDLAGAEPLFREALTMVRHLFPGDHPAVAISLNNLAALLRDRGDPAAAELLFRESLEMFRRLFPGGHPAVVAGLGNLATLLQARGDLVAAEPLLLEIETIHRQIPGVSQNRMARNWRALAELYEAWNATEPNKGYDMKAAEWRMKLVEAQAATQPAAVP